MTQSPINSTPKLPLRRAMQFGARLALASTVLLVGYWVVARLTTVLHDAQPTDTTKSAASIAATPVEPAPLDALSLSQLGGSWEFLGAGWSLAVGSTNSADRTAFFAAPLDDIPVPLQVDPIETWLTSLFDRLSATAGQPTSHASTRSVRNTTFQAFAFETNRDGRRRLVAARGLIAIAPDQWATIEAKRAVSPGIDAAGPKLLPYPVQAERLAIRRSSSGAAIGEFAKAALKIDQLVEFWRAAGATITLNDGFGVADTREGLCVFDGKTLRFVLWDPDLKGDTTILVLDPTAAPASIK